MTRPVLVTGASGKLGAYVVSRLVELERPVVAWSGSSTGQVCGVPLEPVNLADTGMIKKAFRRAAPAAVIHCAALSAIGDCYKNPALAETLNVQATQLLGELSERMLYTSTDLVFDGRSAPYAEDDPAEPLSVYGRSKLRAEQVLQGRPGVTIVRMSLMYGPALFGSGGFFEQQCEAFEQERSIQLFKDEWRTPISLEDAAEGLLRILDLEYPGVLHLGGPETLSREDMGRQLAEFLKKGPKLVEPVSQSSIAFPEPRPSDVSLNSEKTCRLLNWYPRTYHSGLSSMM